MKIDLTSGSRLLKITAAVSALSLAIFWAFSAKEKKEPEKPILLTTTSVTGALLVKFPPQHEVLKIKRPWISVYGAIIVRVTDDEWKLLEVVYGDSVQNKDSTKTLTFMADDPANR